jgi:hypothetical protein
VKLSKTLAIPLVGLLLVVAAGAVVATTGPAPATGAGGLAAEAATPSPAPSAETPFTPVKDTALDKVLGDLVTKGTITDAQKTAILDGLAAERTARQAERKAAQAERKALREKVKGFLSDGAITQAELDQLPADHPLRQLTTLMADGKITLDELKSLGRGSMMGIPGMGFGDGHGWRHFGKDNKDKASPSASPAAPG